MLRIKNLNNQFRLSLIFLFSCVFIRTINAQETTRENTFVDDKGVIRWMSTDEEVKGFGVNYTVPFAHAYRTAKRLGIDPKKAIDDDVYHFTRLGFDLYRVHVWDTQISDEKGNLIENEYLDTFDYLLYVLKKHNINYVITPIAFWGDGWPEPDSKTPGFSHKYGKAQCLTNPDAIKAQQNYLYQFINHINPYTNTSYKNDSNIIAFEVSNEPHHKGEAKDIRAFVKGMVSAIRRTGTKKPIFYNMSHGVHFADDYFNGGVQGGTFQWYPTGLGYQQELSGNLLPNVDDYNIPFDNTFKKHKGAKLVYEFDAADVGRSYIYPAMARSFRSAGIQIATHFAYDPTYMANVNTEYNTHYMNLVYTPQKALSLKICAEVFREISMFSDFGTFPENKTFGDFSVDYNTDLAEYNTTQKFFYTNTTNSQPKVIDSLMEIAGYGDSDVVKYEGRGAYFLDKLDDGLWRLEVMPDAIWVDDPFGRNSPKKTVGVINWRTHMMQIALKQLGQDFEITPINDGNNFETKAQEGLFKIRPGTYILSANGTKETWKADDNFKTNKLKDFFAPAANVEKAWMMHEPLKEASLNSEIVIKAQYMAPQNPDRLLLVGSLNQQQIELPLIEKEPYNYEVVIPKEKLSEGFFNYYIVAETNGNYFTFPAEKEGKPNDWDFYDRSSYRIPVVDATKPIILFDAMEDSDYLVREWRPGFKPMPSEMPNNAAYEIHIEKLHYPDTENLNAQPVYDYSMKHFVLKNIRGRVNDLISKSKLIINAKSLNGRNNKMTLAFVLDDGSAYGNEITINNESLSYNLLLNDLVPVKTVTLPRPYPTFLPYYFEHLNTLNFDINRVESIQISFGSSKEIDQSIDISISSITLE